MSETGLVLPNVAVDNKIYIIRGKKVMLDSDLAFLYEIDTKRLNEAVKRNHERFPTDFMFQLNDDEQEYLRSQIMISKPRPILRSQIATLRSSHGKHTKYCPYAFTELGIAMLSSVLRSPRAIQVNIQIMRSGSILIKLIFIMSSLVKGFPRKNMPKPLHALANCVIIYRISIKTIICQQKKLIQRS